MPFFGNKKHVRKYRGREEVAKRGLPAHVPGLADARIVDLPCYLTGGRNWYFACSMLTFDLGVRAHLARSLPENSLRWLRP